MKLILMRHAAAEHNAAFRERGGDTSVFTDPQFRDAALSAAGQQQARDAAQQLQQQLPDGRVGAIWSSPLTRCVLTAEAVFERVHADELVLHDGLLEIQGGGYVCNERASRAELGERFHGWDTTFLPDHAAVWTRPESYMALRQRMFTMLQTLRAWYSDAEHSSVLVISHQVALRALTGESWANAEFRILDDKGIAALQSRFEDCED